MNNHTFLYPADYTINKLQLLDEVMILNFTENTNYLCNFILPHIKQKSKSLFKNYLFTTFCACPSMYAFKLSSNMPKSLALVSFAAQAICGVI